METMIGTVWRECIGVELETPFQRMTFAEADRRFGPDQPHLRFEPEVEGRDGAAPGPQFGVFAGAETVRYLRAPKVFSRSELAELEEVAKQWGAKGLAYLIVDDSGEVRSPIAKFLSPQELEAFAGRPGESLLFAADDWA